MLSLDTSIFYFFYNIGQKLGIDWLFIFFASYLPYLIVAAFLYLVYKSGNLKTKIYYLSFGVLASLVSRGIVTEIIRYFVPRIRPFIALNIIPMLVDNASSFPSGHTTFLFPLAFIAFLINKKWGWILIGASLVAVLSRIVAGVHWPSDIVGGIVVAYGVFALLYYLIIPPKKIIPVPKTEEDLPIQTTN